VVRVYENNVGAISQHVSELIADAIDEFGGQTVVDAIEVAVENNVRKWSYVNGILSRWRVDGRQQNKVKTEQGEDGGYYV
jgi:DnaD/phage-associated family protein